MGFRSIAQRTLLGLSYRTRAAAVWDRLNPGRTTVLMYHGVPTRDSFEGVANYWGYNVPVREFEEQILYLKRWCNLVSLRDLMAGQNLSRKKSNVVITFDDGYENNCTEAFQVLKKHQVPAVYALATSFVRNRKPLWNDVVEFAVNRTKVDKTRIQWRDEDQEFPLKTPSERENLYHWLMYKCVTIDQANRDEFLDAVFAALELERDAEAVFENDDYRPMTEEQIRDMANSDLVEFASHSVQHFLMAEMPREKKREELVQSKREIEEMTGGVPCTSFCVPGGSYNPELLEEAFDAGYACVLTSDVGTARRGDKIMNRNGVFRRNMAWFSDLVHGPVGDTVRWARKTKHRMRANRGGNDQ